MTMSIEEELATLKARLNLTGQNLSSTWNELSSLLDTYQATLAVREKQSRSKDEKSRNQDHYLLQADLLKTQTALAKAQKELLTKDKKIDQLNADLMKLTVKHYSRLQKCSECGHERNTESPKDIKPSTPTAGFYKEREANDSPSTPATFYRERETDDSLNMSQSSDQLEWQSSSQSRAGTKRPAEEEDATPMKLIKMEPNDESYNASPSLSDQSGPSLMGEQDFSNYICRTIQGNREESFSTPFVSSKDTQLVIHAREQIPASMKNYRPRRRCHLCYSLGKRKDTRFYCPACPRQPAFCKEPCFEIYHSNLHKVQVPVGESPNSALQREVIKFSLLNSSNSEGTLNIKNETDSIVHKVQVPVDDSSNSESALDISSVTDTNRYKVHFPGCDSSNSGVTLSNVTERNLHMVPVPLGDSSNSEGSLNMSNVIDTNLHKEQISVGDSSNSGVTSSNVTITKRQKVSVPHGDSSNSEGSLSMSNVTDTNMHKGQISVGDSSNS